MCATIYDMKFIDIHCHMDFKDFDTDRDEVIKRTLDAGGGMINVGVDVETSKAVVELAHKYPNMWATVGVHPTDNLEEPDFSELEKLAQDPKVVAIGECGLDYAHGTLEDKVRQYELFKKHIALANKVRKPLMLHVRNGKTDTTAYTQALELLKTHAKVPFNFHFFAGSLDDMINILYMEGTISLTGVLTFAKEYDEVARQVPMDRFMTETDSPFAAPVPYRGKRNEPLYVQEVIKAIARLKGESEEKVAQASVDNARRVFGI
jgi:TatD DNase family protein